MFDTTTIADARVLVAESEKSVDWTTRAADVASRLHPAAAPVWAARVVKAQERLEAALATLAYAEADEPACPCNCGE